MSTNEPVEVAIYCRVSTADQQPKIQEDQMLRYCESRAWSVYKVYTDHGVSGAKESRPALDKLMADAREHRFSVFLCWKVDRAGRSLRGLTVLLDTLRDLDIAFVSMTESFDTSSPMGRAVYGILSVFSELDRENTRLRVRAALAHLKKNGKKLGRPQRWTQAHVEKAKLLRAQGKSWRTVAQAVGLPVRTIRRAVTVAQRSAA